MTTMDSCSERALPGSFNLITSVRNTLFKSMWLVLSSSHRETSWSNGAQQQEVKPIIRRWKWRNETEFLIRAVMWGSRLDAWRDFAIVVWSQIWTLTFDHSKFVSATWIKENKNQGQQPQLFFSLFNKFTFISNISRHVSESTRKTSFTVNGRLAKIHWNVCFS